MIQQELRDSDLPGRQAAATASEAGGGSKADKQYSSLPARAAAAAAAAAVAPSSQLWLGLRDPRIVRVSRTLGGKDRHSKVNTVRGLRDRRVRLSVQTAIQLYDLQDRLGLSQPSKVVDWLLDAAQHEIDKLPPLHFPPHFPHVGSSGSSNWGSIPHDHVVGWNRSINTALIKEGDRHRNDDSKEGHDGGRAVHSSNSMAVSYQHLVADNVLSNRPASTVTAAVALTPGSHALRPSVASDDRSCLYYNHRLAVAAAAAAAPPSQLSLLPVFGGTQSSSTPAAALLLCTPGTIAMPDNTSSSPHDPKLLDHFHSVCTTTATGTSPLAAPLSYFPSTISDSFPAQAVAAAPNSISRLLS